MAIGRIPEPLAGIQEAILDAKGDLISATAADTPARLAVGSNNQILMADSAQSTGLKWAASATSTLTAKGDLLTATAANTIARLGVGADGTTLVADSAQSTGLKWAAASAAAFVGCLAKGNTQTISNNTDTTISFGNADVYDTDNFHDTTTNNSRITIPTGKGGYYLIYGNVTWANNNANARAVYLYKNGVRADQVYVYWYGSGAAQSYYTQAFSTVVSAAAGDYFQIYVNQVSGGNLDVYGDNNLPGLRFGCALLGV